MSHFADALLAQIEKKQSPLCLGLDPHWELMPEDLKQKNEPARALETFLCAIVEAVSEVVACVKPQLAFFEQFGSSGFAAFERVCSFAKEKGLIVIVDGKRNDIGSTAAAYAEAYLGKNKPYDALTVTPFLGSDGITPFVEKCMENDKGIFVLVKTSNPSAGEFQDLPIGDELWHEHLAHRVAQWGQAQTGESNFSAVGAVVGATYPDEMRLLRQDMPEQIFLVPGYGAQGAGAEDVKPAFYKGAKGAIVNSSRGILFAYRDKNDPENFVAHALAACQKAKAELWVAANT